MFSAYDMMVMDELEREENERKANAAIAANEKFLMSVGFDMSKKYYVAHANNMNREDLIPLSENALPLEEAQKIADEYTNRQRCRTGYSRYLAEKDGIMIVDYGSWSDFIYYIPSDKGGNVDWKLHNI